MAARIRVCRCAIAVAAGASVARNIGAHNPPLPEVCIATSDESQAPGAGMLFAAGRFVVGTEDYWREEAPVRGRIAYRNRDARFRVTSTQRACRSGRSAARRPRKGIL